RDPGSTMVLQDEAAPTMTDSQNRRHDPRIKVRVPVELIPENAASPIRGATSDLSLSGCYIETIFPFPKGTTLDLKLEIGSTVLVAATVVTSDPQVGNGISFLRMLPEDRDALAEFLKSAEQEQGQS